MVTMLAILDARLRTRMWLKAIVIAESFPTNLADYRFFVDMKGMVVSVSWSWMSESLSTNSARERPQAFVDVFVKMKRMLWFKASVTVYAAPAIVFTVHLAAKLVVACERNRSRTDHETLLTLYRAIWTKTSRSDGSSVTIMSNQTKIKTS